jgi:glutamate N-acetyltransferase / amino-acid N-acetyltransferase
MSVTYPLGFRAAGIAAGLKPSGRPDLALLVGAPGTTSSGVFTTNRAAAAPVALSRARLGGGRGTGVVVNSGQANAATGARGGTDALAVTRATAALLGVDAEDMLACSTGVIGEPLHMEPLLDALPVLVRELSPGGGDRFAQAILTTDTVPKCARADAAPFRVGGSAKGVGMISPNLATMLSFVTTDAPVTTGHLRLLLCEELAPAFEAVTIDGCTSTNDSVLLFASGAAGGEPVTPGSAGWQTLAGAVAEVGESLRAQLIRDAEGGSHVLIVEIEGTRSDLEARAIAKAVADSPLVKTAAFGEDPNPGRILQAVGSSGVEIDPSHVDVWIGATHLVHGGVIPPAYFESDDLRTSARRTMSEPEYVIRVRAGDGVGRSRVLGCDLSYDYVRINGEYTT